MAFAKCRATRLSVLYSSCSLVLIGLPKGIEVSQMGEKPVAAHLVSHEPSHAMAPLCWLTSCCKEKTTTCSGPSLVIWSTGRLTRPSVAPKSLAAIPSLTAGLRQLVKHSSFLPGCLLLIESLSISLK